VSINLTLLATLDEKNIKREQVDYIVLTHIHLDHAGGAGALIKHLPNVQLNKQQQNHHAYAVCQCK
jgi:glyoxylase-like metal-dependent hydrolase (beta-lactamase superfamily II)